MLSDFFANFIVILTDFIGYLAKVVEFLAPSSDIFLKQRSLEFVYTYFNDKNIITVSDFDSFVPPSLAFLFATPLVNNVIIIYLRYLWSRDCKLEINLVTSLYERVKLSGERRCEPAIHNLRCSIGRQTNTRNADVIKKKLPIKCMSNNELYKSR